MATIEHYPFMLPNAAHMRRGWHRAAWTATREEIERLGGRICGAPEVRTGGGGTASHVQSCPTPSGPIPTDLANAGELVLNTTSTSMEAETGAASGDDPAWGARLLP